MADDYDLPESFIAQTPADPRDSSRLMLLDRQTGEIEHHIFREVIDYINPSDVLVLNVTRVIPARLRATKADSGGGVEVLLLRQMDETRWQALVGGRRVLEGTKLVFGDSGVTAEVISRIAAEGFALLDAPPQRLNAKDTPIPYHPNLWAAHRPTAQAIANVHDDFGVVFDVQIAKEFLDVHEIEALSY